jgi:multisubunit Na+/H+ antiporter MnhG subunit
VKAKWNRWLPVVFLALFALSRWPGLFPPNFSAATALAFCAGVYFRGAAAWWLPLGTMLATDVMLNVFYYHVAPLGAYLLLNYAIYAGLIGLGRWFGRRATFMKLLMGGLLGAVIFYLVTNTLSWLQDPAYAKTIAGWIQALTTGRLDVHPTTWEMFRNTLGSGGLFTALFAGSAKLTETAESPADKKAGARDDEAPEAEETPKEAGV